VNQTQETLKSETQNLVSSLRRPNVRGRWGELTLRRVAELTGMSEHCDFNLQTKIETDDGSSLRPDMTVHLPRGVIVPVDSKVPLDQYLDAMAATSDTDRKEHLKKHANALRERMKTLASKDYAGDRHTENEERSSPVFLFPGVANFMNPRPYCANNASSR